MFAKNSKAYSVYLLFRFVCSLAVSMSTVLSVDSSRSVYALTLYAIPLASCKK